MKKYPEYKEVDIGWLKQIPKHWKLKRVKHSLEFFDNIRKPLPSLTIFMRHNNVLNYN